MCFTILVAKHLFSPKYRPMISLIKVLIFILYYCGASRSCKFLSRNLSKSGRSFPTVWAKIL
jgi:hypothetical protein